jgi:hypothetical protein
MCLDYLSEEHPVSWIRDNTPALSTDEILQHIPVRDSGWTPENPGEEFTSLSSETGPVAFRHSFWTSSPPSQSFFDMIEDKLSRDLPTIAIVDSRMLREGYVGGGPVHAVVVTGIEDSRIMFNDPWGTKHEIRPKHRFADAWDAREINQVVHVDISEQSTIQEALPEQTTLPEGEDQ